MPLYEYECASCGERFERILRVADPPVDRCPLCGEGPVTKLVSAPAVHFKGSGWYVTDYAKKSGDAAAAADAAPSATPAPPASDSKPAAAPAAPKA
ncbi:MAG TPA: zinc ribbon domain-containing protein [Vicinamibacterales bacterium]|nr:zinc ribbon domain-containing protein [Vicinamibacterales bacterium]HOF17378.1 zinc ribbon domain-containing protein [Phycisphaerae bacterium]HOQ60303.1 zinc ribbon domain-containing protein [Vicinamibacterales bacterium]HPK72788.1 zinc ribbon domain-containing protein [Vicinamibacterales bacterium]HPW21002.1 zinc ribbon domain-containing protein [Vicinamibacterales bacterium]